MRGPASPIAPLQWSFAILVCVAAGGGGFLGQEGAVRASIVRMAPLESPPLRWGGFNLTLLPETLDA